MQCFNIDYFPREEYSPDPNDSTMAIPCEYKCAQKHTNGSDKRPASSLLCNSIKAARISHQRCSFAKATLCCMEMQFRPTVPILNIFASVFTHPRLCSCCLLLHVPRVCTVCESALIRAPVKGAGQRKLAMLPAKLRAALCAYVTLVNCVM
jgi:hypothetical protein